ncbi:hypothetical protein [Kitasatospora sp. NPDC085879]|uniref:hypothetical protein n=1 Tax=Kitasatospora sp. NPDC085879 TaxID=3154769 RepID=UPI003445A595
MTGQAVRRTAECGACGGVVLREIGQVVRSGRLGWGVDTDCGGCSAISCDDSWGPAPDSVRQALLAEYGAATVRPAAPPASRLAVLRALREDGTRSLAEARRRADELVGTGLTGTLVETEYLAERLRQHGVPAVVEPAGAVPGQGPAGR